jgi:tetratricopeptide (TPR) repeat protein
MAIEGRFGPGGVADLLCATWLAERTGTLELHLPGAERKLALRDGAVVYVTSADASEKLTVRMVAHGVASKEAILAASKAGNLRHELASRGVAVEAYDRELASLVEEVVIKIFQLKEGRYQLVDMAELGLTGVLEDLDMTPILWKAARASTPAFAEAFLGPLAQRVQRLGRDEVLTSLTDLSPQEGYLLSRIDGYGSANDVISMSPLSREQTLVFLLGLCVIGMIDVQGRPGVKLPRPPKPGPGRKAASKPAAKPNAPTLSRLVSTSGAIPGLAAPTTPAAPEAPAEGLDAARALLLKIKDADHYQALGLKPSATPDDIRRAYYALARAHHPDRHGRDLGSVDRETVEALFARISEAFSVLSDEERRPEYDERLKSGAVQAQKDAEKKPVDRKEMGRESHAKARALLAQGDRARALAFFEHAVESDPDNWEFRMALAGVLMSDTRTRKRAEPHLVEAIRIDRTKAEAYYQLGLLYKMAGVKSRALEQFRTGREWEAGHAGIEREIAEIEGGKPGDAAGGLLGGLFGKKK